MARDVNALINKCENAITQEHKAIRNPVCLFQKRR